MGGVRFRWMGCQKQRLCGATDLLLTQTAGPLCSGKTRTIMGLLYFFFSSFFSPSLPRGGGLVARNSMFNHVTLRHNRNICASVCFCSVYCITVAPFPSGVLMNDCAILTAQSQRLYGGTSGDKKKGRRDLTAHSGGETEQLQGLKSMCAVQVLRSRAVKKGSEG